MPTSFEKRYQQECAEDEEIGRNEAAELRIGSREPELRELVEFFASQNEQIASQNEQIAALKAIVEQLAHANALKHQDDERRHRELLRVFDALHHSLSEPAIPTLGNMGRGSWPLKQIPNPTYENLRPGRH